jgi:predicted negative regulator of RcsB-dependent stress response
MLSEIKDFVKANISDIILFIIVTLLIMLSFAVGYITAKYQQKEPIQVINPK